MASDESNEAAASGAPVLEEAAPPDRTLSPMTRLLNRIRSISVRNLTMPPSSSPTPTTTTAVSSPSSLMGQVSSSAANIGTLPIDGLPSSCIKVFAHREGEPPSSPPVLLFTSEAAYYTLNPTWLLLDMAFEDLPPDLEGDLNIRVMRTTRDGPTWVDYHRAASSWEERGSFLSAPSSPCSGATEVLAEFRLNPSKLYCLPPNVTLLELALPLNALVLELADGSLCLPGPLYELLQSTGSYLGSAPAKLLDDEVLKTVDDNHLESMASLVKEQAAQDQVKVAQAMMATMSLTSRKEAAAMERDSRMAKTNLMELKAAVAAQKEAVEVEKRRLGQAQEHLGCEVRAIRGLMEQLQSVANNLESVKAETAKAKEVLLQKEFLLESRQIKLLSELQSIYPIQRLENQEYAIRGLELPSDLNSTTRDDEYISSALGYVCHLVFMLSKYLQTRRYDWSELGVKRCYHGTLVMLRFHLSCLLEVINYHSAITVPLRYVLEHRASRSQVKDAAQEGSAVYPLYRRGVERDRFDVAVTLLRADIQQLLYSRGVSFHKDAHMLQNLQTLFNHELYPSLM